MTTQITAGKFKCKIKLIQIVKNMLTNYPWYVILSKQRKRAFFYA